MVNALLFTFSDVPLSCGEPTGQHQDADSSQQPDGPPKLSRLRQFCRLRFAVLQICRRIPAVCPVRGIGVQIAGLCRNTGLLCRDVRLCRGLWLNGRLLRGRSSRGIGVRLVWLGGLRPAVRTAADPAAGQSGVFHRFRNFQGAACVDLELFYTSVRLIAHWGIGFLKPHGAIRLQILKDRLTGGICNSGRKRGTRLFLYMDLLVHAMGVGFLPRRIASTHLKDGTLIEIPYYASESAPRETGFLICLNKRAEEFSPFIKRIQDIFQETDPADLS